MIFFGRRLRSFHQHPLSLPITLPGKRCAYHLVSGRVMLKSKNSGGGMAFEDEPGSGVDTRAAWQLTASEKVKDWRSAREQFRLAFEAAPTGMMMIDPQGRIVLANPQGEKLFGYDLAELIGKLIEELVPERLRKDHSELRNHFFKNPQTRLMGAGRDLYGRRKDGGSGDRNWFKSGGDARRHIRAQFSRGHYGT